jgi:signal transduction histidine kinase
LNADAKFVHDMKNMLGIIIGYSNLLLDEMSGDDPKRPDVEEIRKAGDKALVILDTWNPAPPNEELK